MSLVDVVDRQYHFILNITASRGCSNAIANPMGVGENKTFPVRVALTSFSTWG